jgi:hypothetical protein
MAITATAIVNQASYKSWTVVASDADTTGTFAHGFSAAPDAVILIPTYTSVLGAALTPMWSYTVTATTITLNKTSATSSGGTTTGTTVVLKVVALLPHTVMQG